MATLERAFPSAETVPLRRVARRTTIIRLGLALALVAALALAFLAARDSDVRHAPLVPSGTTGVVVLDLSASVYEAAFGSTLQKMARQGERAGLVVFSDSATRYCRRGRPAASSCRSSASSGPTRTARPAASPPTPGRTSEPARASPRVLAEAHASLVYAGAKKGSILIVSDLEILPDEVARLGHVIADVRRDGIDVRILAVNPSAEKRQLMEEILGKDAFLKEKAEEAAPKAAPEKESLGLAAPWIFMLAAGLVVVLLAANERLLARLEVRR